MSITPPIQDADMRETPEQPGLGYFDYQARTAFRDLTRLYGFEEARRLMAEIINTECGRKYHG